MQIFTLIRLGLQLVNWLTEYAEKRSLISDGQRREILRQHEERAYVLRKAVDARNEFLDRVDLDGLRDYDYRD